MKRTLRLRDAVLLAPLLLALSSAALACDTWVSMSDVTDGPRTILAKNSDRPAFDSQPLVLKPHQLWEPGAVLDLGRISIPQVGETYATLGSHPYWCWGYEEGINEHGVAIGNEGIWTRPLIENLIATRSGEIVALGLTGMDLVRLGLERGKTAHQALVVITMLLEEHGQFGSGTPTVDALSGGYDNSFIIADSREAWILETAGRQWTARRIEQGSASISNDLSIRTDWELASDQLEAFAIERGWWSRPSDELLDFRAVYGDGSALGQRKSALSLPRSETTLRLQREREGAVSTRWMMTISRDQSSSPSVDQGNTASSCVAVLPIDADEFPVFWWAPARPSVSCYVPFFVHSDSLPGIVSAAGTYTKGVAAPSCVEPDAYADDSYWWLFRRLADLATEGVADRTDVVRSTFDALEEQFAADMPEVLAQAKAMRVAGHELDAATMLATFSAQCVDDVWSTALELIERLENEAASADVPEFLIPYLGNFEATFDNSVYSVVVKAGSLAVDVPGQRTYELNAPDAQGMWTFAIADTLAVSFLRDAEGDVTSMILYQNGLALEFLREGYAPKQELSSEAAAAYVDSYRDQDESVAVDIIYQNGRLAVCMPGAPILELRRASEPGSWIARATEAVSVEFHGDPAGLIMSMTVNRGGQVMELARDGYVSSASTTDPALADESLGAALGIVLGLALLGILILLVSRGR